MRLAILPPEGLNELMEGFDLMLLEALVGNELIK
jgi:hypothetical protein